ncbi:MAG: HigA family addiction module antitoxin [Bacteroidota bacterium]
MRSLTQHSPPHPGEILSELYFAPLKLSHWEAAKKLGISSTRLSSILDGRMAITSVTAAKLARAFQTTPWFWLNLQINYDLFNVK